MTNHLFIIGGQRCGSTYLYHLLDQHPEILMAKPVKPEPKFFLQEDAKGFKYEDYLNKYFKGKKKEKYLGEKSTSYYENELALRRIQSGLPESKIIFCLRNPVERAYSNYKFSIENKLETRTPEEVFIEREPAPTYPENISVNPFNYIERGFYSESLDKIFQIFNPKKVFILILEKLIEKPNSIQELYFNLGVNSSFIPSIGAINKNSTEIKEEMSKEIEDILKVTYQNEILKLESMLKTDLQIWKK